MAHRMTDDKTMTVEAMTKLCAESCMCPDSLCQACNELHERVVSLSAALQARVLESDNYKLAWQEYDERTRWVQDTAKPKELGMHRADVLRQRIEQAEAECARLRELARKADELMRTYESTGISYHLEGDEADELDALLSAEVNPHVEPVGINAGVEGGDA